MLLVSAPIPHTILQRKRQLSKKAKLFIKTVQLTEILTDIPVVNV